MDKELILIACSYHKEPGGVPNNQIANRDVITSTGKLKEKIITLRREMATARREQPGEDLGFEEKTGVELMPAFQRYTGRIYQYIDLKNRFLSIDRSKKLMIISALYGIVFGEDLIRDYDFQMKDEVLELGIKANAWWRQHHLSQLLAEYIIEEKFERVHILLSEAYKEALNPWPDIPNVAFKSYDYPGIGQGATMKRAEELKRILNLDEVHNFHQGG